MDVHCSGDTHRQVPKGGELRLRRANHTGHSSTALVTADQGHQAGHVLKHQENGLLPPPTSDGWQLAARLKPRSSLAASSMPVPTFLEAVDILTQTHCHSYTTRSYLTRTPSVHQTCQPARRRQDAQDHQTQNHFHITKTSQPGRRWMGAAFCHPMGGRPG